MELHEKRNNVEKFHQEGCGVVPASCLGIWKRNWFVAAIDDSLVALRLSFVIFFFSSKIDYLS